jgi:nucleotide-binding universal stress UspA family protein
VIKTILVPVDGSAHANTAVDWASDLAVKYDAQLVIVHVIPEGHLTGYRSEMRQLAKIEHMTEAETFEAMAGDLVRTAVQRARSHGATKVESSTESGDAAKTILAQAAQTGAQLIVMGRRGLGGLPGLVLGSVSSKVLQLADCACLTVK